MRLPWTRLVTGKVVGFGRVLVPTGFANGLHVGWKRRAGVKNNSKAFNPSPGKGRRETDSQKNNGICISLVIGLFTERSWKQGKLPVVVQISLVT